MSELNEYYKKIKQNGLFLTVLNSVNSRIDRFICKPIAKKLWGSSPLQDAILLESHNDFDSNGGAFYDYLIENGYNKNNKIIWMLVNKVPNNLPENVYAFRFQDASIRKWKYLYTSKWMVWGHWNLSPMRQGQISVYAGHGSFIMKRVKGIINIPDDVDYVLCPSNWFKEIYADQLSIHNPENRLKIIGFPVFYSLFNNNEGDLHKLTTLFYKKTILWTPTFRQVKSGDRHDSQTEFPLGIPVVQNYESYVLLNESLRNDDILLVIKIHPMQDMSKIHITDMSNIRVLDAASVKRYGIDNYRLMKEMDAMIGDYSSITAEFMTLDRPIAYCLDDYNHYNLGFVVDNAKDLMPGSYIYCFEDLLDFIEDVSNGVDRYKTKRKGLCDVAFEKCDVNSCQRLCDLLGMKRL